MNKPKLPFKLASVFFLFLIAYSPLYSQNKIDPETISLNYWYADPTNTAYPSAGDFSSSVWSRVNNTKTKFVRLGGKAYNVGAGFSANRVLTAGEYIKAIGVSSFEWTN